MKNHKFKIKVIKNGPYLISGGIPLSSHEIVLDSNGECLAWRQTREYPEQQTYSLCRCGKSRNYPYCDGSHVRAGFNGTETANHRSYLEQSRKYTGPSVNLTDVKVLCAHAGFCDRAGGTWNLVSQSDDPEARRIAIEETANCPSGRLVIWEKGGSIIEPFFEPSIRLVELSGSGSAGPIWVTGGIPVESASGVTYEVRNRVTLCGCGRSSYKPFCDGSHRQPPPA